MIQIVSDEQFGFLFYIYFNQTGFDLLICRSRNNLKF